MGRLRIFRKGRSSGAEVERAGDALALPNGAALMLNEGSSAVLERPLIRQPAAPTVARRDPVPHQPPIAVCEESVRQPRFRSTPFDGSGADRARAAAGIPRRS